MKSVTFSVLARPRAILLTVLALSFLLILLAPDGASADDPSALVILEPRHESWLNDNNITFNWSLLPEAPQVDYHIELWDPNGTLLADTTGTNETIYSYGFLPDMGGYNWTLTVNYTAEGKNWTARMEALTFGIDTVLPQNPDRAWLNNDTIPSDTWQNSDNYAKFYWSGAEDLESGIAGYYVYFGPDPEFDELPGMFVTVNASFWGTWVNCVMYLKIAAVDDAWNIADLELYYIFKHDWTPPTNPNDATQLKGFTESDVWQNNTGDPVFTWTGASDKHSFVDGYSVYFGEDPGGTSDDRVIVLPWNAGEVPDGTYYLRVSTRDAAGNQAVWTTLYVFRYDATPPGEMTAEAEVVWIVSMFTRYEAHYSWSTPQDISGVEIYEWRVDDDEAIMTTSNGYITPPPPDGYHVLYVRAWDVASNVGDWLQVNFTVDTTPPTGAVLINDGDDFTNDTAVALTINATDDLSEVSAMRFSDDGYSWAEWIPYNETVEHDLPSGDGEKTIHVQFRDRADTPFSEPVSDTIVLDTTRPSGTLRINGGDEYTSSRDVTLSTYANDANGIVSMRMSVDPDPWTPWMSFANLEGHTLTPGDGRKTVRVQVMDPAGLVRELLSHIVLDTTPPTGTILINGGETYSNSAQLHLTLSVEDETSGVIGMMFSEDGVTWGDWEPYSATRSMFQLSPDDGERSVYVKFQDAAFMWSTMIITDTIILDTAGPTGTIEIEDGRERTGSREVGLDLTAEDINGVKWMRFSSDGENWTEWEAFDEKATFKLPEGEGRMVVHVQFRDAAGTVSTDEVSDDIILEEGGGSSVWLVAGIIAAVLIGLLLLALARSRSRMKFD